MLERLRADGVDMVVGSRYVEGGGFGDWSARRLRMSQFATRLAKRLTGVTLSDPMSGFFMINCDALREKVADLTGVGYKILLDILSAPGTQLSVAEIPYTARSAKASSTTRFCLSLSSC